MHPLQYNIPPLLKVGNSVTVDNDLGGTVS